MLNETQINSYKENGFLILKNLIQKDEIQNLKDKLKQFENYVLEPNIICEENGDIRSIFAPETQDQSFEKLYKDQRILIPGKQLLDSEVYLYQYKLNLKKPFGGKFWEWHQDFPYWYHEDGVKTPHMVSVMILLDNVKSFQGPLLLIPKSHKEGIVQINKKEHLSNKNSLINSLNTDLKYTISNDLVKESERKNGIVSIEGMEGLVVFFHPNIFHASNSNISPYNRSTAIITYNSVNNIPQNIDSPRPEYISYRNHEPLKPIV